MLHLPWHFFKPEFLMNFAGVPAGLRSFKPTTSDEVIPWDFLSRSEYSLTDSNPRRRIHSDIKEGLEDITREVMASINACSRQRGRVVEERSTLYGYRRVDSYGADTILDLLLVYRKYRGRKVTLPVRRHVYLHQHFTGTFYVPIKTFFHLPRNWLRKVWKKRCEI